MNYDTGTDVYVLRKYTYGRTGEDSYAVCQGRIISRSFYANTVCYSPVVDKGVEFAHVRDLYPSYEEAQRRVDELNAHNRQGSSKETPRRTARITMRDLFLVVEVYDECGSRLPEKSYCRSYHPEDENPTLRNLQTALNALLVRAEDAGVDSEEGVTIELTPEQAERIAATREYRDYCLRTPDALRYDPAQAELEKAARMGGKLWMSRTLYGIPVKVHPPIPLSYKDFPFWTGPFFPVPPGFPPPEEADQPMTVVSPAPSEKERHDP